LENKKKKRKTLPPCWAVSQPKPAASPPPRARAPLLFRPISGLLPRARQTALRPPSLSLANRPHPSAALARSHARPHWQDGPACQPFVVLPPSLHRGHLRPSPPSPPPSSRRTGKFGTAPSSHPLDQRPRRYRPAVMSPRRRCAAFMAGTVKLAGIRRAPPLPSPRAPIKGSPRAPSSLHRPRPLPFSPHPRAIREAPSSSPSPVSPFPSSLSLSVGLARN
jgi:hypothetical protein